MGDVPAGSVFIGSEVEMISSGSIWQVLFIGRETVVLRNIATGRERAVTREEFGDWFLAHGHKPIL